MDIVLTRVSHGITEIKVLNFKKLEIQFQLIFFVMLPQKYIYLGISVSL